MSPTINLDVANGVFEGVAGVALLLNCLRLRRDKEVKGVSVWTVVWFTLWGLFNLVFYPAHQLMWSFLGGILVSFANLWWLALLGYYECLALHVVVKKLLAESEEEYFARL